MSICSIQLLLLKSFNQTTIRCLATHWNPRFRKLRAEKIDIPNYEKIKKDLSESFEEQRSRAKKEGIEPPISFDYKPINIAASGEVFDPYVPPEGDGKRTVLSKEGINQRLLSLKSNVFTRRHVNKIKNYEQNFDPTLFAEEAQRIFIEAHEALANRDSDRLIELVTEYCYPKMWSQNKFKTIRWKWIQTLEQPEPVKIITREMMSKSNIYAQITVRMHSQQTLAVYDRFGRIAYGDKDLIKNVIEYVVFEKHLTDAYSSWRVHDKIIPEWAEPKMPIIRTYSKPKSLKVDDSLDDIKPKFKKDDSHLKDVDDNNPNNKLATA